MDMSYREAMTKGEELILRIYIIYVLPLGLSTVIIHFHERWHIWRQKIYDYEGEHLYHLLLDP